MGHTRHTTAGAGAFVVGFLGGIVVCAYGGFGIDGGGAVGAATVLLIIVWRFVFQNRFLLLVSLCLFGVSIGMVRFSFADDSNVPHVFAPLVGSEVELLGVVRTEPDVRSAHTNLTVSVETINGMMIDTRVLVRTERYPEFSYGDRIKVVGVLAEPEAFLTELGRTFDYAAYLKVRGVHHTIAFAEVTFIEAAKGDPLIAILLTLKAQFMKHIEAALPEPSAGLAEGITLGVKRALGEDLEAAFRRTGIIHIVVLSGYNVSIVAEGIMRLLSAFLMPRARMVFGIAAISAFALIAGLSATVVRASLMAGLILYARASGNTSNALRALVFAGMVMLLINPLLLLHDPGFQLSFLATFGLITLSPIIEKKLFHIPSTLQIREFVTATLATQIFILPFLLFQIGEFSVVSVLVNVLVLPVIPLAMLGTFLIGVAGFVSSVGASLVALPTFLLLSYVIMVAEWFSARSFAAFMVPPFSFLFVIAAYAAITLFLFYQQRKNITPHL